MSSGTLRAEAICCALALPASSSRCERPASSALSACAMLRPSSGEIAAAAVVGVVGLVSVGVAARGARCGSGLLRAPGELRPAAGEASGAGRAAFCAGLRRGFAVAGEGEPTDWLLRRAPRGSLDQPRRVWSRWPVGFSSSAWNFRLRWARVLRWSLRVRHSRYEFREIPVPAQGWPMPCWSGGAPEGVPRRCLFSPRHSCCALSHPGDRRARLSGGKVCGRPCRRSKMSSQDGRVSSPIPWQLLSCPFCGGSRLAAWRGGRSVQELASGSSRPVWIHRSLTWMSVVSRRPGPTLWNLCGMFAGRRRSVLPRLRSGSRRR